MAEDKIEILGRWHVRFGQFLWEYTFSQDGVVRWRDPFNGETGVGRWSLIPNWVNLSWSKSTTKETWNRPVKETGQSGWIEASYRTGSFSAEKIDRAGPPVVESDSNFDFDFDPATGNYVLADPKTHKRYIDRVFTAVAYGILPDGYYVYCQDMALPIMVPEHMVDFGLATAESERSKLYDSFSEAKSAASDSAGRRRVAYFWGAGGAVVSPTIIGPATTPELYSTIVAVRDFRDAFVSVMLPAITLAIGMISGPTPMTVKGNQKTGRIAKRRGGNEPARKNPAPNAPTVTKIKPVNGQVSVGGGHENPNGSNLNPINPNSGGPARGIPNHVLGGMEDMAEKFEPGSVKRMISSKLRYVDVDWTKGTNAAARVMAPKGTVAMNVWTQGPSEQEALRKAFTSAGFKNVKVVQVGYDGSSTMVMAEF